MSGRRMVKSWITANLVLIILLWAIPIQSVYAVCPGNVAPNPSFEEGFTERGAGEVTVANGWQPFWQDGPDQESGFNRRPEFKPEDGLRFGRDRIHDGNWGQKWYTVYATHHGGIYQQVNVPAGAVVTLSAWAQAWSSSKDDSKVSNDGVYELSVGIDPTGGTDFSSPNVVWSGRNGTLDQWVELKVQAKAQAGQVTIYLRGDAGYRLKHNDAYFDDVCLTYVAPTPRPTARPQATATPAPTDTPEPTATPESTPTDEPTPTPEATATPVPGSLSVYVFDDRDADGRRTTGEPLLAGARIELTTMDGQSVDSYTTTGSAEPYIFGDLQPGNYVVSESDPPGYASTSPNQWAATLLPGASLELYFADRFEPSPTPTRTARPTQTAPAPTAAPTVQPTETSKGGLGDSLSNVSGILVAMVALILPIVYRLLRFQV
ncbi:MAG: hypothetical protein JXA74_03680 [Anaerolineae bacterium]|nr:hypothetical protein [Anaerolineae bacterium]